MILSFNSLLHLYIGILVLAVIVFFHLEQERYHYSSADSTRSKYTLSKVCASPPEEQSTLTTFHDRYEAISNRMNIVHCGECGHCSNVNDIEIMKNTKDTLTKTATKCAVQGLLFGHAATDKCLEESIGFTSACSSCWSDNVRCTREKCRFTCLKSLMMREPNNYNGIHLNPCLECDEKLCGPAFIECAGANRRRLGIESDIKRSIQHEQCNLVASEDEML